MSQYDRLTEVRRLKVRNRKALHYAAILKATALNIIRAMAASKARMRAGGTNTDLNQGVGLVFWLFKERISGISRSIVGRAGRWSPKTGQWCKL